MCFCLATYNLCGVWQSIRRLVAFKESCPHPGLYLEDLCVFYKPDKNAVMKLCPTFLCILTWESPWRGGVCECVECVVQYSGLSLEKTGRAACAFLKWAAETSGGIITMETEMEMMLKLKSHRIYWPKKKLQKGCGTLCFWSQVDEWAL